MPTVLQVRLGSRAPQEWSCPAGDCTFGSAAGCQYVVPREGNPGNTVSAKHARLRSTSGGLMLEDLNSDRGTFLNGQALTHPTPLKVGDRFSLGRMGPTFTVKTLPEPVAGPPAIPASIPTFKRQPGRSKGWILPAAIAVAVIAAVGVGAAVYNNRPADNGMANHTAPMKRVGGKFTDGYALLIGVSGYDERLGLTNLKYPERDIQWLYDSLVSRAGYHSDHVVMITQSQSTKGNRFYPNRQNIREQLEEFLAARTESDTVLVAFAGHGIQIDGHPYFCPADVNLSDANTLVSLTEIYDQLGRCPSKIKMLITDACRDQPLQASPRSVRVNEAVAITNTARPQDVEVPGGIAVLFGCAGGEQAWEHDELGEPDSHGQRGHGVFFYYFGEGLSGKADGNQDGQITATELTDYTQTNVAAFVRDKLSAKQQPSFIGKFVGSPVVGKLQ